MAYGTCDELDDPRWDFGYPPCYAAGTSVTDGDELMDDSCATYTPLWSGPEVHLMVRENYSMTIALS